MKLTFGDLSFLEINGICNFIDSNFLQNSQKENMN